MQLIIESRIFLFPADKIFTGRVSEEGNDLKDRLCPPVRRFEPADLWSSFFCMCIAFVVTVLARRRLKVKVKLLGQCRWSVQISVVSAESYKYWLMAVVICFHCHVIGCKLARTGVRHGAPEASGSSGIQRVIECSFPVFTARCYASAVLACVCVCHKSEFY